MGVTAMKRRIALLLALSLTLVCMLCAGAQAEEAVTVTLSDTELTLEVGKTAALKATILPKSARKAGVAYLSSNEAIATVNERGKITAVSVGECEVIASSVADPAATATVKVRVVIAVKKMALTLEPETLYVGQTAKVNVAYSPMEATYQSATFTSARPAVATVTEDGRVTGISKGSANIIAVSADGKCKTTLRLNVGQLPESIVLSEESIEIVVGKQGSLRATVLPKNANNQKVTWFSADESIATVDSRGRIKAISRGETTITATSLELPQISASATVKAVQLATGVTFDNNAYQVLLGQTVQVAARVQPDTASNQSVTYSVRDKRIAAVDENGLLTGLKGGKTTVYATAADGSRKRAQATVEVIVPVTGVSYKRAGLRVGAGGYGTFTAEITPKDASNKNMTWVSADESIASVSGTTNRFKVKGHRWGRTKVTGTTEDGGYTVTVDVNVGTLRNAIRVVSVEIRNGRPYLRLRNRSDMNITEVRYVMRGFDAQFNPIDMSTAGKNPLYLYGTYEHTLSPGDTTSHGSFTFYHHSDYADLAVLQIAITGWSTSTGYYTDDNTLRYDFDLSSAKWDWVGNVDMPL